MPPKSQPQQQTPFVLPPTSSAAARRLVITPNALVAISSDAMPVSIRNQLVLADCSAQTLGVLGLRPGQRMTRSGHTCTIIGVCDGRDVLGGDNYVVLRQRDGEDGARRWHPGEDCTLLPCASPQEMEEADVDVFQALDSVSDLRNIKNQHVRRATSMGLVVASSNVGNETRNSNSDNNNSNNNNNNNNNTAAAAGGGDDRRCCGDQSFVVRIADWGRPREVVVVPNRGCVRLQVATCYPCNVCNGREAYMDSHKNAQEFTFEKSVEDKLLYFAISERRKNEKESESDEKAAAAAATTSSACSSLPRDINEVLCFLRRAFSSRVAFEKNAAERSVVATKIVSNDDRITNLAPAALMTAEASLPALLSSSSSTDDANNVGVVGGGAASSSSGCSLAIWDTTSGNSQHLEFSKDTKTVSWSSSKSSSAAAPCWLTCASSLNLHSGTFELDFTLGPIGDRQVGVGFMLRHNAGLDWGFFGYLGASRTAWSYDPTTGDVVTGTESIEGNLPKLDAKAGGVVTIRLVLMTTMESSATAGDGDGNNNKKKSVSSTTTAAAASFGQFKVGDKSSKPIALPNGCIVVPACCLLAPGQSVTLSDVRRE